MINTSVIYDGNALCATAIYAIDGCFYRYNGKDPRAGKAPRYIFQPLPGQRRHADLILNNAKLALRVHVVEGMVLKAHDTVTGNHIQLSLF